MSTHADIRQPPTTEPGGSQGATRRYGIAAWVAAITVLLAVAWGAAVLVPLSGEVADLPRSSDIPGELTVTVDEAGEHVVYYERETWFASVPMNPDLAVEVAGPDGQALPVEGYEAPVHYRLPGLVGEAFATFDATQPGEHTVTVQPAAEALPDDARAAVGPSIAASAIGGLIGPVVLLVVGLLAAAVIAARAAAR